MLEEDLECSEHWGEVLRTPWPSFLVSSGPRTHKQAHVPSGAHLHGRLTLPALPRTSPHSLTVHTHTFRTLSETRPPHSREWEQMQCLRSANTHTPLHTHRHRTRHAQLSPHDSRSQPSERHRAPVSKLFHPQTTHASCSPTHPSHTDTHSSTALPWQATARIPYFELCLYPQPCLSLATYTYAHTIPHTHTRILVRRHICAHKHAASTHALIPYLFPRFHSQQ